jgi:hypothetical protein
VWPPITRADLKLAVEQNAFDSIFPILVRRLIAETALGLTELEMPGESGVLLELEVHDRRLRASVVAPGGDLAEHSCP